MNPYRRDISGVRFGKLVAISPTDKRDVTRSVIWLCHCDCGNQKETPLAGLRTGLVVSCGCFYRSEAARRMRSMATTHGRTGTREYRIWNGMRNRCSNPNNSSFKNYGGRGITVCARWNDFLVFLSDMGACPSGLSIDRINNDGNYEPGNCRWADRFQQAKNRRWPKLDREDITYIRQLAAHGVKRRFIAEAWGVEPSHISTILNRANPS